MDLRQVEQSPALRFVCWHRAATLPTGGFHHFLQVLKAGFRKPICRQWAGDSGKDTFTQAPHMDGSRLILLQMTDMCFITSYTFAERFDRGTDKSTQMPAVGMEATSRAIRYREPLANHWRTGNHSVPGTDRSPMRLARPVSLPGIPEPYDPFPAHRHSRRGHPRASCA